MSYDDDDDSARGGVVPPAQLLHGPLRRPVRQPPAAGRARAAAGGPRSGPGARAEPAPAPAAAAPAQPVPTTINQPAAGRPVQIVTNAPPRMQIAAAPLPLRAPPAAERLRGNAEEEAEPRLVAAPLPAARPAMPGTAVAQAPEPPTRPTVLAEPTTVAQAPLPPSRPQVLAAASSQPTLPPLITTGEQRGRQTEGEPAPAMALAFASPSQPVTLPGQGSLQGPQPRPAQAVRAAPQAPVQAAAAPPPRRVPPPARPASPPPPWCRRTSTGRVAPSSSPARPPIAPFPPRPCRRRTRVSASCSSSRPRSSP